MDNIHLSISRYLDGELTDEELARLAAVLETDASAISQLAFNGIIHAQLLNWMDQHDEQGGVTATASGGAFDGHEPLDAMDWPATTSPAAKGNKNGFSPTRFSLSRARQRFFSFGTLAAAVIIAASVSIVAYVIASRPIIVGQLTDATGCQWGASPAAIGVGTLLKNGQDLELIAGRAVITFASGAKVLLEGPASMRLKSPTEIHLNNGHIAAKVPRQAIGFTVHSSLARFVDLGTAFTLLLRDGKSFELHVFEGLVELQLDERFGEAVHHPVRVAEITAVSFDINSGDIAPLHFEEGKEMPF